MNEKRPVTRAEALAAYGEIAAEQELAIAQMTPREQAEAAWTPTGPPVDDLEDRIRADRGLPPLERPQGGDQGEVRRCDGT